MGFCWQSECLEGSLEPHLQGQQTRLGVKATECKFYSTTMLWFPEASPRREAHENRREPKLIMYHVPGPY